MADLAKYVRAHDIDKRLFCRCGEIGEVKAVSAEEDMGGFARFRVFCRRGGAPCCMTQWGDTPEEAIVHWESMNREANF